MSIRITQDAGAPTAAVEIMLTSSLADYELEEIEAPVARDVDPILASQGFKDLLDDARSILHRELAGTGLEVAQLTGAICHDGGAFRPGIWLVLRESESAPKQPMTEAARKKIASIAERLCASLRLA